MGIYEYLIIFLIAVVFVFLGAYLGILYVSHIENNGKSKRVKYIKSQKSKEPKSVVEQIPTEVPSESTVVTVSKKSKEKPLDKIVSRESFTEMNCEFDGIDEKDVAKENAEKQDEKYSCKFLRGRK